MTKSVLVGISGGIDSAAAAFSLLTEGFRVEGLFLHNGFFGFAENEAARVAGALGIPLHVFDASAAFHDDVTSYFVRDYLEGRTPNPCIHCNKKIKFRYLLEEAAGRGIDYVATGHYARIACEGGHFGLFKGVDTAKDQSYFLYVLGEFELSRILFPNGNLTKDAVREIAARAGLASSHTRESQEICFIPDHDYVRFIEGAVNPLLFRQGNIVDLHGRVLGTHRGIHTVTVGQRRGLTIASAHPLYVIDIDAARNEVIVGGDEEQFFTGLVACDVTWHLSVNDVISAMKATVKIRYRHGGVESDLYPSPGDENRVTVIFSNPQKAVAPGQAAVFYQGDKIIGGGWIKRGIRDE